MFKKEAEVMPYELDRQSVTSLNPLVAVAKVVLIPPSPADYFCQVFMNISE